MMQILLFPSNEADLEQALAEVVVELERQPLPDGYIYTLVSFLTPGQVRVQAMAALEANAILDTGRRVSGTAETLAKAVEALKARLRERDSG